MKNALKMLKVVWPESIPAAEYAKALEVIAAADVKPRTATKAALKLEQTNEEKVKAALSTGPATAREVADATGLSLASVKYVLAGVAVVSGQRPNPGGFGLPANLFALKKGA